MYRDNSLVPSESMRLLALGFLQEHPLDYATLAGKTRQFTLRIVGPSLDLIGTPLEVLKIEGFVDNAPLDHPEQGSPDSPALLLTARGREEFERLMASNLRAPLNDMSKLVLAIKMRFLHLAPVQTQQAQYLLLVDLYDRQLERLQDLRAQEEKTMANEFTSWLDLEMTQTHERLQHYEKLAAGLSNTQ